MVEVTLARWEYVNICTARLVNSLDFRLAGVVGAT